MDRHIVYPASIPLDTDILSIQRHAMISDGFLAQAMLGNGPVVNGLVCAATAPASMQVVVGPGILASLQTVDATAFGSLAADNQDPLVKVGINLTSTTFALTAPATAGNSINYLIEAGFSEQDVNPVVLPYWNAANPSVNYSGPNNSGTAQFTDRIQRVVLNLVAGAQAPTGTQTTPSANAGTVPLYVITVANGASLIAPANIAVVTGAPFIGGGSLMPGRYLGCQKWTVSGTYTYTPTLGTNRTVWQYVVGAGGSGGGAAATAAGQLAAGSGGGSGSYVRHEATSGFAGATIVIGSGGIATAVGDHNGTTGGTTSVTAPGFVLTAPGGQGGYGQSAQSAGFITGAGPSGAVGTGGNIVNSPGTQGGMAVGMIIGSSFQLVSGQGGPGPFGQGANQVGGVSNGEWGGAPGSGGGGGASGGSGAGGVATSGGAGADGCVIVLEYT